MASLKKITFYYNGDKWENYNRVVKVEDNMSNMDIAKKVFSIEKPDSFKNLIFFENKFFDSSDGISTYFEVKNLDIIDLT